MSDQRLSALNPIVLVEFLEDKGFSRHQILSHTNINSEILKDPKNQLTIDQYKQLMVNAMHLTNNRAIGLEFGHRLNFTGAGLIGMGGMAAPNLRDSLLFSARTARVLNPAVNFAISGDNNWLYVEVEEAIPWGESEPFMVETAYSICAYIIRMIDPIESRSLTFSFTYPAQTAESYYQAFLSGTLEFNSTRNRISIPRELAERKAVTFNALALTQAEKLLEQLNNEIRDDRNAIIQPIRNLMLSREGQIPNIEEVAHIFHISSRTLNRRLNKAGTTFSQIVVDVRRETAIELLKNTDRSIHQITQSLGYSDATNFTKAFKTWFGITPSQYRETHKSP